MKPKSRPYIFESRLVRYPARSPYEFPVAPATAKAAMRQSFELSARPAEDAPAVSASQNCPDFMSKLFPADKVAADVTRPQTFLVMRMTPHRPSTTPNQGRRRNLNITADFSGVGNQLRNMRGMLHKYSEYVEKTRTRTALQSRGSNQDNLSAKSRPGTVSTLDKTVRVCPDNKLLV